MARRSRVEIPETPAEIRLLIEQLECSWQYNQVYGDYDACAEVRDMILDLRESLKEMEADHDGRR
jgi:hypothetical protein